MAKFCDSGMKSGDKMLTFSMMIAMEIDEDERAILAALRSSPRLKACILEMVDITDGDAFEELNNGDDAEEAVVDAIQKTGTALLPNLAIMRFPFFFGPTLP